jgi:hypothetical protein
MSREAWLTVVGTGAFLAWSVVAAQRVTPAALGLLLAGICVALPIVGWSIACVSEPHRRQRLLLGIFTAEFLLMVLVDTLRWLGSSV